MLSCDVIFVGNRTVAPKSHSILHSRCNTVGTAQIQSNFSSAFVQNRGTCPWFSTTSDNKSGLSLEKWDRSDICTLFWTVQTQVVFDWIACKFTHCAVMIQLNFTGSWVDLASAWAGYQVFNWSVCLSVIFVCFRTLDGSIVTEWGTFPIPIIWNRADQFVVWLVSCCCVCMSRSICGGKMCFFNICTNLFYVNVQSILLK